MLVQTKDRSVYVNVMKRRIKKKKVKARITVVLWLSRVLILLDFYVNS